jgi:hypothetical protein
MMSFLLQNGAFVDFRVGDPHSWKTPLHFAAEKNKPQCLKVRQHQQAYF